MATLTLIPASLHPSWSWIPGSVGPRSGPARTPFQWCPKTVRHQPGTLSDTNRNGVRQKSERCPTEIGISVRQPPEYASGASAASVCVEEADRDPRIAQKDGSKRLAGSAASSLGY